MTKIDLKDRKILYELDKDSRSSNKEIARKVSLSEQVVGNRIQRLLGLKVIDYFYVKTNPSLLGHTHLKIYLRFHNLPSSTEKEMLQQLLGQKHIFWLCSLRGKYDLVVSLYVKSLAKFSAAYDELFGSWGEYILERKVILLEKASTYTKAYLVPGQTPQEITYTQGSEQEVALDDTDLQLLRILNLQGRRPLTQMATQLSVSADTVKYRVRNLQQQGVITGFGVKINFEELGHQYSIISLKLQNMNAEKYRKLETLALLNKNIIIYLKTIGDHDLELEVETSNKEELDMLLKSLRDNLVMEIKDYEILEVLKEHRMSYFPF